MNKIKTHEVFKDWFKNKSILDYESEIDSFLYELKDLSVGYEKFTLEKDILYCFIIRNYNSKEDEINIFLEEIESFTKSIDIIFYAITNSYNYKGITV